MKKLGVTKHQQLLVLLFSWLYTNLELLTVADAKIVEKGIWSDTKSMNETYYELVDGFPRYLDRTMMQSVKSAYMTPVVDLGDIFQKQNVQLVNSILPEADFNELFKHRNEAYENGSVQTPLQYINFLTAVAQFPAFCGEYKKSVAPNLSSLKQACKRELATLFAHITHETKEMSFENYENSGLTNLIGQNDCPDEFCQGEFILNGGTSSPDWWKPTTPSQQYYGRGPMHLKWMHIYARFSQAYFDWLYHGKGQLLAYPESLLADADMMFSSALWLYMTPQYPHPSAHSIITGLFEPNEFDQESNARNDFGTTILVMSQDQPRQSDPTLECGNYEETDAALSRANLFNFFGNYLGLAKESAEANGCGKKRLDYYGSGQFPSFWTRAAWTDGRLCMIVDYPTEFSVYNQEDYKRCVCKGFVDEYNLELDPAIVCPQQAEPAHCHWMHVEETQHFELLFPVATEISVDIAELVRSLQASFSFATCEIQVVDSIDNDPTKGSRVLNAGEAPDFVVFELLVDNRGRRMTDVDFRAEYANRFDAFLGADAPSHMYVASTLGQTSLIISQSVDSGEDAEFGRLETTFEPELMGGEWLFAVRACVDRRDEEFNGIDCEPGNNMVTLRVADCASLANPNQYPECDGYDDDDEENGGENDTETVLPEDVSEEPGQAEDETTLIAQNQAPYFEDNSAFEPNLHQVEQGAELIILLPAYSDDDGDEVVLSAPLTEAQAAWISFDPVFRRFVIRPDQESPLNLTSLEVILDDTEAQQAYKLNLWVHPESVDEGDRDEGDQETDGSAEESEDQKPDEPTVPGNSNVSDNAASSSGQGDKDTDSRLDVPSQPAPTPEQPPVNKPENLFDPSTLYARDQSRERIREERFKVLAEIDPVVVEELPEPKSKIQSINQNGDVRVIFSQEMFLEQLFGGSKFKSDQNYEDIIDDELDDQGKLRALQANADEVDLLSIIEPRIIRGSFYTSAPQSKLSFQVELVDYDATSLSLKFNFDSPLSLSIGDTPDILAIRFIEPDLFTSKETGKTLEPDEEVRLDLPKQFISNDAYQLAVITGSTVQVAANLSFMSQFGVTICLAVSLKAMWNLMHVMQVLAYLRLLVDMPANSNMMLLSMHNAITLENILDRVYGKFLPDFDESDDGKDDDTEFKQELKDNDISYDNLYLGLGVFGLVFALLLLALLMYYLLRCMSVRVACCNVILRILKAKLFYNVWLRYMIESNLKVTSNCIFFLYINGGNYESLASKIHCGVRIFILTIIVIWPFFATGFLVWKRNQLGKPEFQRKFISMYAGVKTSSIVALMYTSVFCVRRFVLVIALLVCGKNVVFVIVAYHVIQTVYFFYMTNVRPHEEKIHNLLEYFNELCLILIQYMMVFFVTGSDLEPELQWDVGTIIICIVILVFSLNMLALIYLSVMKVLFCCRVRKARKAFLEKRKRRFAFRSSTSSKSLILFDKHDDPLNDAHSSCQDVKTEAIELEGFVREPTGSKSLFGVGAPFMASLEPKLLSNQQQPSKGAWPGTALADAGSSVGQMLQIEPEQDSCNDVHVVPEPSVHEQPVVDAEYQTVEEVYEEDQVPMEGDEVFYAKVNPRQHQLKKLISSSNLVKLEPSVILTEADRHMTAAVNRASQTRPSMISESQRANCRPLTIANKEDLGESLQLANQQAQDNGSATARHRKASGDSQGELTPHCANKTSILAKQLSLNSARQLFSAQAACDSVSLPQGDNVVELDAIEVEFCAPEADAAAAVVAQDDGVWAFEDVEEEAPNAMTGRRLPFKTTSNNVFEFLHRERLDSQRGGQKNGPLDNSERPT